VRLLIPFERGIGLHLGGALGFLARLFFRCGECPPRVLGRALCVSAFGDDPVRGFAFGRADLARSLRFHPCRLPLGGLSVVGLRRCAHLSSWACLALAAVCWRSAKPGSLSGMSSIFHFKAIVQVADRVSYDSWRSRKRSRHAGPPYGTALLLRVRG
jgi:hypothetical protein